MASQGGCPNVQCKNIRVFCRRAQRLVRQHFCHGGLIWKRALVAALPYLQCRWGWHENKRNHVNNTDRTLRLRGQWQWMCGSCLQKMPRGVSNAWAQKKKKKNANDLSQKMSLLGFQKEICFWNWSLVRLSQSQQLEHNFACDQQVSIALSETIQLVMRERASLKPNVKIYP